MIFLHLRFKISSFLIAFLIFLNLSSSLYGQFQKVETKNLVLIYLGKPYDYVVPHLIRCFENSLRFHENLFNYTPSEKVIVFLQDFSDYHNAGATSVPRDFIRMYLAPANYVFETNPANERMNWVMSHELVHVVATDQATGFEKFFRSLFFGKVQFDQEYPTSLLYYYLTTPRWLAPRWYHEGIAVFLETWMAGGLGRAQGPYDEMVFRSMVRDSSYIYDVVGLESEGTTIDFQVGVNAYLYGTRFVSYLAYTCGPEKVLEWAKRNKGSKSYFASQFKNVYKVSLEQAWSDWIAWEKEWQRTNLKSIHENPATNFHPISDRALGSVSRAYLDKNNEKLYVAVLYPGQVAHIASINMKDGEIHKICEVKGPALYYATSLAYNQDEKQLYFTTDNNRWRDLNVVDLTTGKTKRLMQDVRTGDLAFNKVDQSLWGVRHYNGISTLVRIPKPYHEWNQIYSFPYGQDIFDIDVSPDGSMITASLVGISGQQKLIKMNVDKLMNSETTFDVLFDFGNVLPEGFVFSGNGRFLYGSSYYSGVSNIYRYDFQKQDMDILSNCESGFFRPVPFSKDSLIVMRYTGEGFAPGLIANQPLDSVSAVKFLGREIEIKYPIVRDWVLSPPSSINIDSIIVSDEPYHPSSNVKLNSVYPIFEGYKDYTALGMHADLSDLLGVTGFDITASYSPFGNLSDRERLHLGFNLHYWEWILSATYNGADFYDLFGPTKTSRKGYSLGLQYNKNLIYDKPKTLDLNFSTAWYGGLERLPDFQNVTATYDKLLSAKVGLDYQYIRRSLGAVDEEKGIAWQFISQGNYVNTEIYPRLYTTLDYGIPLPLDHSSLWLRSSAGYSFGNRNNPFANFFFGGFGNNWIDRLTEKRYRDYYSFPGMELNAFGGKNFTKMLIEWNIPPLRFRHVGYTSLYMQWARPALFASAIQTNLDGSKATDPPVQFGYKRTLYNLGGQIDFRFVLLSRFNSTFSIGYATAFEKNNSTSREFMISLKIL